MQARCAVSRTLQLNDKKECDLLYWHLKEKRYRCAAAGVFGEELSIDQGCPSNLNSWYYDVRERSNNGDL
jgi:hypothetical protein